MPFKIDPSTGREVEVDAMGNPIVGMPPPAPGLPAPQAPAPPQAVPPRFSPPPSQSVALPEPPSLGPAPPVSLPEPSRPMPGLPEPPAVSGSAVPPPFQPVTTETDAYARAVSTPPKTSLLQRLGAMALGGAAGYANAGGRVRIDPRSIDSAAQNIMYPGRAADLARRRTAMEIEQQKNALGRQAELDTSKIGLQGAQTAEANARAKMYGDSAKPVNNPLELRRRAEAIKADPASTPADIKAADDYLTSVNTPKPASLKSVWVHRPDKPNTPVQAFVNPRDPSGYVDEFGAAMPEGTVAVASPAQQRMFGKILGLYYYAKSQVDANGNRLSEEAARDMAGQLYAQDEGIRLGRVQQMAAVDQALSSIGLGRGFDMRQMPGRPGSSQPSSAASPATQPSAAPSSTPSSPRAPKSSLTGLSDAEFKNVNFYLSTLLGTVRGGGSKAAQVRSMAGQESLARLTGLDPMTLNVRLSEDKAAVKQIGETVQRAGAIERLNNTIDQHGAILESAIKPLSDTGSPLFNGPVREWKRKMAGSPDLKKFEIAINAVQREYAYLTAGGAQSRAMLPVTTSANMEKLISPDSTVAEVLATVGQLRLEAKTEMDAMNKTVSDMRDRLTGGVIGGAVGGRTATPQGVPQPGQQFQGETVRSVKKIR